MQRKENAGKSRENHENQGKSRKNHEKQKKIMKNHENLDLTRRPGTDEAQPGKRTKMQFFDRWRALRAGQRSVFCLDRPELAWK